MAEEEQARKMIERIDAALEVIKEFDPGVAEKLNSLSHNVKKKYAGVAAGVIVICHYASQLLGV